MEIYLKIASWGSGHGVLLNKKLLRALNVGKGDGLRGTLIDGELRLVPEPRFHLNDLISRMPPRKDAEE